MKKAGRLTWDKNGRLVEADTGKRVFPEPRPITSGWGSIGYPVSKGHFKNYCDEQIQSLKVAIDRKSKGSTVEDGYFMEHLNKLKDFFMNHYVEE